MSTSITKIENRLKELEKFTTSPGEDHLSAIFERMIRISKRMEGQDISEDNMSVAEICSVNINWSNNYDFLRVMRYLVQLRREYPTLEKDDRTEFLSKLRTWLASRGPSTCENTILPQSPVSDDDVAVCNELSRIMDIVNEHDEMIESIRHKVRTKEPLTPEEDRRINDVLEAWRQRELDRGDSDVKDTFPEWFNDSKCRAESHESTTEN
ncbi:hypothetical protein [uncultured Methanolobus sp.]|uniref:hypothetical protein n=1 Tax=uncultured Methanolobus sp. TaxID=218300 RepID=UPI0029C606B3|nr:hypothetical protein [uncultured Methanolobus sp.]